MQYSTRRRMGGFAYQRLAHDPVGDAWASTPEKWSKSAVALAVKHKRYALPYEAATYGISSEFPGNLARRGSMMRQLHAMDPKGFGKLSKAEQYAYFKRFGMIRHYNKNVRQPGQHRIKNPNRRPMPPPTPAQQAARDAFAARYGKKGSASPVAAPSRSPGRSVHISAPAWAAMVGPMPGGASLSPSGSPIGLVPGYKRKAGGVSSSKRRAY